MQLPDFRVGLVEGRRWEWPHAPNTWIGPFVWDSWVIDWIAWPGTRMAISTDGRKFTEHERPQWSWYIFAPGVHYKHSSAVQRGRHFDGLWFFFHIKRKFAPLSGRPLSAIVDPEERLGGRVREMYALQQSGEPGARLTIHAHALSIFAEILTATKRGGEGTPQNPWRVQAPASAAAEGSESGIALLRRLDAEVLRQLSPPPTIGVLAEALNMSVSSLAHRFRRETGMSVMERVRWLRIREARAQLTQPGASVKAVARKLAFSSPFHLSKVFHDITGMTPGAYMKRSTASTKLKRQAPNPKH